MGLLSGLLLLPVTGPVHGLRFVLESIRAEVNAEMLDEGRVQAELMAQSLRYDLGEISAEDFAATEAVLLEQLNAIRAYAELELEPDSGDEDETP